MAMQLTNICRDVLEDAHRDRLYLPASVLARRIGDSSGLPLAIQKGLVLPRQRKAIVATVRRLLERADDLYTFASNGFRFIPLRSRIAVGIAAALYRAIGVKLLRRQGGDPLLGRVMVSLPAKIALAGAACASVLVSLFRRRPSGLELSPFMESRGDCPPGRPQWLSWSSLR
jgi:15-cis-phytoene synthase